MTWVFAVVIVLAMGGVAVVASGRGGSLAPAYDDRPDSRIAAGRALSGEDLREVRFSLGVRGYRMAEVDALLDRLAEQLDQTDTSEGRTEADVEAEGAAGSEQSADDSLSPPNISEH